MSGIPLVANPFRQLFALFDNDKLSKVGHAYDKAERRIGKERLEAYLGEYIRKHGGGSDNQEQQP